MVWISCINKKPERWETVLLCVRGIVPKTVFTWNGEAWLIGLSDIKYTYEPDYWTPLPIGPIEWENLNDSRP